MVPYRLTVSIDKNSFLLKVDGSFNRYLVINSEAEFFVIKNFIVDAIIFFNIKSNGAWMQLNALLNGSLIGLLFL